MKALLKPKFYHDEMDNPYYPDDKTKAMFWKWERFVFGRPGEDGQLMNEYILRGMKLLMNEAGDSLDPDVIPDYIQNARAPLEEKAFVAQIYSNELGQDPFLQNDPTQIDWTAYFRE